MPTTTKVLECEALRENLLKKFHQEGPGSSSIGLELELWPFRESEGVANNLVRFRNESGTGLIQLLQGLQGEIDGLVYTPMEDGTDVFVVKGGGRLTFEPGGQLEYSGPPLTSLPDAITDLSTIIETLRCALKPHGIWFFQSGLNPWHSVEEVGLNLNKPRYINMDRFFAAIGPYGQKMMRLSTSLQVNLDSGDAETAPRRWLAANLLAPVFCAAFGNSPFIDGRPTKAQSFRSIIWQNLDPSRSGFPAGLLDKDYKPCPVSQYFEFALDAFCLWLPDNEGQPKFDGFFRTFRHWMECGFNGYYPDWNDWEVHLTTLFPEVRVKGFFELRYLDAQSRAWCTVPGILLTQLLYDERAREEAIEIMMPYRETLQGMLREAAMHGLRKDEMADLTQRIFKLALRDPPSGEWCEVMSLAERFYKHYTAQRRNPAVELLALNDGHVFTPAQYRDLESRHMDMVTDLLGIIKNQC